MNCPFSYFHIKQIGKRHLKLRHKPEQILRTYIKEIKISC